MTMPLDNVIQHTLHKMYERISQKSLSTTLFNERSGLLYTGNIHDAIPRQLFLDERLSSLDKMAWVIIRLHAQQNEGAVFPTYNELQVQLASPHSEKASRETISRALLMLRLTGWLSLCKRIRDESGKVRGNIYAQHDEPLGLKDCEYFDPTWLDCVEHACQHSNKTIRLTALTVLQDIKSDNTMRHRHSRIALIEARLSTPQTPQAATLKRQLQQPGSIFELSENLTKKSPKSLSSKIELSQNQPSTSPGSESELSLESSSYHRVRKSNCYVRINTDLVNNTYVESKQKNYHKLLWSDLLIEKIASPERDMLEQQLALLPENLGQAILDDLNQRIKAGKVNNVIGYLLSNIKRARNGQFNIVAAPLNKNISAQKQNQNDVIVKQEVAQQTDPITVAKIIAEIREQLCQ